MNSRRVIAIARWVIAFGSLAGIVLLYRRWLHVNTTTVALSLLLLVLVLAAEWGLRYAVGVAIVATILYNFFFLPPIGTFTISDPENWLALFAFLSTAIIASRLSERARDEAAEARARQRELEVMVRLSRELLQSESAATLLGSVPGAVASVTGASSGLLYMLEGDRIYGAGMVEGELRHVSQIAASLDGARVEGDEVQVPIRSGVRARGLLMLRGVTLSVDTAEAIGSLISLSIDRVQALESVTRGEAAKESERLRTLMIDSITHELRTPLTSIKGAATTLLAGGVNEEDGRELLTIIDEESDRLNRLVSEAVEMAQLDAQQVQMHFEPVTVMTVVEGALATCAWVKESHTLRVDVPAELRIRADAGVFQKVICNLLENAAKYSAAGTPITISAEQKGSEVAISIADRGAGIDASEQVLIFERFYRARSQTEASAGTGMGLAISRAIAEAHGGRISVRSQVGRGSVFTVTVQAA